MISNNVSKSNAVDVPIHDLEIDAHDALLDRARNEVIESLVERKSEGVHTLELCGFVWDLCDDLLPDEMIAEHDIAEIVADRKKNVITLEAGTMYRDEALRFISEIAPEAARALEKGFQNTNVFPVIVLGFGRCVIRALKIDFGVAWSRGGSA